MTGRRRSERRIPAHEPRPATSPSPGDALTLQQRLGNRAAATLVQRTPEESAGATTADAAEAERVAGDVEERSDTEVERLQYAFFYTGGGYGNSARVFFSTHYPEYTQVRATSFEAMFDRLDRDVRRIERQGRRAHLDEIVIVTHANAAGGLQIPLARDDVGRRRNFTPWDLAALQDEFRDRTNTAWSGRQRFRERRARVVASAIDENTSITVRGCEFGQSEDGLDALRSFFGGEPNVWAPRGYQGYEVAPMGRSHIANPQEAFQLLQDQGLLPEDLEVSEEEQAAYVRELLGASTMVPTQFFVMGPEHREAMRQHEAAGTALSEEAEEAKTREGADIPSLGEHWGLSSAPDRDPELDALTLDEIERRARLLNDNYRPEYAPMLLRLRDAWMRHPESFRRAMADTSGDPLAGLPPLEIFGDSNLLAGDAARFEEQARSGDAFETEDLAYATPDEITAAAAGQYVEGFGSDVEPPPPTRTGSGGGRTEAVTGSGPGGAGRRRRATADDLARARDFDKDGRPPPPPPPPEQDRSQPPFDLDALTGDPEQIALLREILENLPDQGWQLSDTLSALDLGVSIATAPTIFIEGGALVFLWEAAGLVAPLIMLAGLIATIDEVGEVQEGAARALGVELGLEELSLDGISGRTPDATRWFAGRRNSTDVEWQIRTGYPLSGGEVMEHVQSGMGAVEQAASGAIRSAEGAIRRTLRQAGYSTGDIATVMTAVRPRLRRQVIRAVVDEGLDAVRQRREALEAQR
ncbi:MAG: hypothetical protein QNJ12_22195 [Ilumatobacter sp.]|uniref:hypothetical protein n=1 Tax=Ilumatobacter sp. TaxID=1967498 RepID=UPI0026021EBB|nr:hypothetical protein [Ilumatobacter sp.]MDJ0771513.1 hypothetical protein [Ilumatobacter sp.]